MTNEISEPDVTIDGDKVTMTQADTGKWYGYVASASGVAADSWWSSFLLIA